MYYNMISRNNIKIFDCIFQKSFNDEDYDLAIFINDFLGNKISNYIAFVKENESYLVRPDLLITKTGIVGNNYPKINNSGMVEYLNYKLDRFKELLEDNVNYNFHNIAVDLNLDGNALKRVIDYFIDRKIIKCRDEYAKKNILGFYEFDFDKLEIFPNLNANNGMAFSNIENQVNITVNGDKTKFNKNEFSNHKTELEKKKWYKVLLEKIFKK